MPPFGHGESRLRAWAYVIAGRLTWRPPGPAMWRRLVGGDRQDTGERGGASQASAWLRREAAHAGERKGSAMSIIHLFGPRGKGVFRPTPWLILKHLAAIAFIMQPHRESIPRSTPPGLNHPRKTTLFLLLWSFVRAACSTSRRLK